MVIRSRKYYHNYMEQVQELVILCPYCNFKYTAEMLTQLDLCEGSYTADCVSSTIRAKIDIVCSGCKKLVYRKEISKYADDYDELRWQQTGQRYNNLTKIKHGNN